MSSEMGCIVINVTVRTCRQKKHIVVDKCERALISGNFNIVREDQSFNLTVSLGLPVDLCVVYTVRSVVKTVIIITLEKLQILT